MNYPPSYSGCHEFRRFRWSDAAIRYQNCRCNVCISLLDIRKCVVWNDQHLLINSPLVVEVSAQKRGHTNVRLLFFQMHLNTQKNRPTSQRLSSFKGSRAPLALCRSILFSFGLCSTCFEWTTCLWMEHFHFQTLQLLHGHHLTSDIQDCTSLVLEIQLQGVRFKSRGFYSPFNFVHAAARYTESCWVQSANPIPNPPTHTSVLDRLFLQLPAWSSILKLFAVCICFQTFLFWVGWYTWIKISVKGGFVKRFKKRTCPFRRLVHNCGLLRANPLVPTCRAITNGCLVLFSNRSNVLTRFAHRLTDSKVYKCSQGMANVAEWLMNRTQWLTNLFHQFANVTHVWSMGSTNALNDQHTSLSNIRRSDFWIWSRASTTFGENLGVIQPVCYGRLW